MKSDVAISWLFLGLRGSLRIRRANTAHLRGLWAVCFYPLHPPVLPLIGHSLRHVSSGLENEAHRLCLNHSIGRPAWGTAPPCHPASGRGASFAKTEQSAELTGPHWQTRLCLVPRLLWLLLSADMRRTGWTKVTYPGITACYSKWMFL